MMVRASRRRALAGGQILLAFEAQPFHMIERA
jgi:hypothetical protein